MKGDNEQIDNDLEKLIEGDIAKEVGKKMEEYFKKEDELIDFKNLLEGIIEKEGKQLVFIIDELDRCRPDFALRLLERIKHFFDIKGLYFVLGINKNQIEKYIEKIYGNIDSRTYLEKFIDIENVLPKKAKNQYYGEKGDIANYIISKINKYRQLFEEKNDKTFDSKINMLVFLSEEYNLSLRQINRVINYLILFRKSLGKDILNLVGVTISLIFLKLFDIEKYKKLQLGKLSKLEFSNILKLENFKTRDDEEYKIYKEWLFKEIDFIFDKELSSEIEKEYNYLKFTYKVDLSLKGRKRILKKHFDNLENFNI